MADQMHTRAVAFAVRAGHTDEMAHRFLEKLCAAGNLGKLHRYGVYLAELMREREND